MTQPDLLWKQPAPDAAPPSMPGLSGTFTIQYGTSIVPRLPPYQQHSPTSRAAAHAIIPHAGTERRRVYDYLLAQGRRGATDDECQAALGMNPSTQRPRRIELERQGLVWDSGERRKTRAGRQAAVWVVLDLGNALGA